MPPSVDSDPLAPSTERYEALSPIYSKFFYPYGTNLFFPRAAQESLAPGSHSPTQRTRTVSLNSRKTAEKQAMQKMSITDIFLPHLVCFI